MVHGARAVPSLGGLPRLPHLICLTSTLVHAFWLARRQQQAARSSGTRAAAAGGVQQRVMAAAGAKGKALISVSDKAGLDTLAKVGQCWGSVNGVLRERTLRCAAAPTAGVLGGPQ